MCKYDATTQEAAVYVRGYETLSHNDYDAVMNHLGNVGPLSIAIDASSWGGYEGGVFDGCSYQMNIEINHGVQVTNCQYLKKLSAFVPLFRLIRKIIKVGVYGRH